MLILLFLAYCGGVLTILSPCILPVLPFVFAAGGKPFLKNGLPLLVGMAATFALVASLAAVGGGWVVRANQLGRGAALVLFALFGLTLIFESLAERLMRPLVRLGGRLSAGDAAGSSVWKPFVLGIATGLLWAPCAGPILGLILTGAALNGASAGTALLLVAYALGAASSLAVALLGGGRVFAAMKRALGAGEWMRRGLGVAVLLGVAAVGFGLDRGVLTKLSLAKTAGVEQRLAGWAGAGEPLQKHGNQPATLTDASASADGVPAMLPELAGANAWINSGPLDAASLRGKVVVVDFWTYSCINCLRTLPYVNAWYERYKDSGLVVIGVHTPEFPFEKDEGNVRQAVKDLGISYPVAMDNDYRIWRSFNNRYWPAHYFIDAAGKVRYHHFGEGEYEQSEAWIRGLLEERNHKAPPGGATAIAASGVEAATDLAAVQSQETYIGYERADNFASPGGLKPDAAKAYRAPARLNLNEWALDGKWREDAQIAALLSPTGSIAYRFQARDLHLVLGPAPDGKPVRFRVTLDGKAPGADHGMDTDAEGFGMVKESRLYQLIRQQGGAREREFRIEFLDRGVEAFAFTFG